MAITIQDLPYETMLDVANWCTVGVEPLEGRPRSSYARYLAALVRTNKHFYFMLNRELYTRNMNNDLPIDSCVLYAAHHGILATIKIAHGFGANLNVNGARNDEEYTIPWGLLPGRKTYFASPLHFAISYNHVDIFNYLLENNADVHSQSRSFCGCRQLPFSDLSYPLHIALEHRSEDATHDYAGALVERGAHQIAKDVPALWDLDGAGRKDLVDILLARNDQFSLTAALHFGISKQSLDLVNQFLSRDGVDASAPDWQLYKPLHVAISCAPTDLSIIKRLLERPEVSASAVAPGDVAPLHIAACKGRADIATLLLQRPEVNPIARAFNGINALHVAARFGRKNIVEVLLLHPAFPAGWLDVNGMSALHHLCRAEETEDTEAILELLLFHPDNINLDPMSAQGTPLFMAVRNRKFITATALVRFGSNINPPNPAPAANIPHSLLHECLLEHSENQTELVRELIDRGANIELSIPFHGKNATPLFFAAGFAGNADAVKVLLEAGANIHCIVQELLNGPMETDMTLVTAVLKAFYNRPFSIPVRRDTLTPLSDCVKVLLEHGASLGLPEYPSLDPVTNSLQPALEFAVQTTAHGHHHVLDIVLEHSTARNINQKNLDDIISSEVDGARRGRIPRLSLEKLTEFRRRIFPQTNSLAWNATSHAESLLDSSMST